MPDAGRPADTGRLTYPVAARGLLRASVLDAVAELVRTHGWSASTMADVARAAGVSRQTLYNEFGSRRALVESLVGREIELLVNATAEVVRQNADDAHRALREAFALFLSLASDEPLVKLIVADPSSDGELLQLLTAAGQAIAGREVGALIGEVWPQVAAADALVLADSLVRLAISHALLPTAAPDVVAGDVSRMLAPFVDAVLAAS